MSETTSFQPETENNHPSSEALQAYAEDVFNEWASGGERARTHEGYTEADQIHADECIECEIATSNFFGLYADAADKVRSGESER